MSQAELSKEKAMPSGDGWRVFEGKGGGADVRYLSIDEKIVRIDIGTGEPLTVTRHSQERNYVVIPGFGQVQDRQKAFLSKVSMARRVIEERAHREAAEAQAAEARRREQEAVDELLRATLATEQEVPSKASASLNRSKLCARPERPREPARAFIPEKFGNRFAKVPAELIKHQHRFAKDEYRVLEAALVLGTSTGKFYGEKQLSALARVHPKNLSAIRKSLSNRQLCRLTDEKEHGVPVWQLLWNADYYGPYALRKQGSKSCTEGSNSCENAESTTNKKKGIGVSGVPEKEDEEDFSPAHTREQRPAPATAPQQEKVFGYGR